MIELITLDGLAWPLTLEFSPTPIAGLRYQSRQALC